MKTAQVGVDKRGSIWMMRGVDTGFPTWERTLEALLQESVVERLPPNHLAVFMCEATRVVLASEDPSPPAAHALMTALLGYSYANAIFSSRAIAAATHHRVDFMMITGGRPLSFEILIGFREDHAPDLARWLTALIDVMAKAQLVGEGNPGKRAAAWLKKATKADEADDARMGPEASGFPEEPPWLADPKKRGELLRHIAAAGGGPAQEPPEDATRIGAPAMEEPPEEATRIGATAVEEPPEEATRIGAPAIVEAAEEAARAVATRPSRPGRAPAAMATAGGRRKPKVGSRRKRGTDIIGAFVDEAPDATARDEAVQEAPPVPPARDRAAAAAGHQAPSASGSSGAAAALDVIRHIKDAKQRLLLVEVAIGAAISDADLNAIERRRIDQLLRLLRLDDAQRQRLEELMHPGGPEIVLPTVDEVPDRDVRLRMFEHAAIMALADGPPNPEESAFLKQVAISFELRGKDLKDALERANAAAAAG